MGEWEADRPVIVFKRDSSARRQSYRDDSEAEGNDIAHINVLVAWKF
jgi:hypothetical protein